MKHENVDIYRRMLDAGEGGKGFHSLMGHYVTSESDRPRFVRDRRGAPASLVDSRTCSGA